jgi:hypothetical protein
VANAAASSRYLKRFHPDGVFSLDLKVAENIAAVSPDQTIPPQTTVETAPSYSSPDWAAIHEEIACPLCGYNLRGLSEPMCPECGYRFDWPDLLDPTRRRHRWLFEHHPEHNIWSFFKTIVRNFRPGRFWKELHPSQPSKPRRLVIYWIPAAILSLAPVILLVGYRVMQWASAVLGAPPWGQPRFDELWHDEAVRASLFLCVLAALFPWLNVLALLIFQQSMGKAQVKAHHVLRCAIYSGDAIFWWGLLSTGAVAYWLWQGSGWRRDDAIVGMLMVTCGAALLLNFARLVSAYRNYLKFDHVYATIIAAEVVVVLASFAFFMDAVEFL